MICLLYKLLLFRNKKSNLKERKLQSVIMLPIAHEDDLNDPVNYLKMSWQERINFFTVIKEVINL